MAVSYNDPIYEKLAQKYETEFGLPNGILYAIRTGGEKSTSNQTSPKGAKGVYQFMPETWSSFARPTQQDISFAQNPDAATYAAANYARYAIDGANADAARLGIALPRERLIHAVFAEHNGGPTQRTRVVKGEYKKLPAETRDYIFGTPKNPNRSQSRFDEYNARPLDVPGEGVAPSSPGPTPPQLSDLQVASSDPPPDDYSDPFGVNDLPVGDSLDNAFAEGAAEFGFTMQSYNPAVVQAVDEVFADG